MALKIKLKPRKEQQIPDPTTSQNNESQTLSPTSQQHTQNANSPHLNSEEDAKEGSLKRKHPSPTSSSVSKRMCREDSSASSESREVVPSSAGLPEVLSERCEQLSAEPLVIKQRLGSQHVSIAALLEREHQGRLEDDDSRFSRVRSPALALENISHGQLQVISVVPSSMPGSRTAILNQDNAGQFDSVMRASIDAAVSQQVYPFASWSRPDPQPLKSPRVAVIPAHASWFAWDRIHKLERQAMPQFFFGKSKLQSAETFMKARNAMIIKYRSNPQKPLSVDDVREMGSLGNKELRQILDFLIQWGLLNYQAEAISESAGFRYPTRVPVYLMEDSLGGLSLPQLSLTSLEYLYRFEVLRVPSLALKSLAMGEEHSSLATEIAVKEASGTALIGSLGNTCSACASSCSNNHFYCEKQADYVLCRECYSNGNLGIGMTTSDFMPFYGQPEQTDNFDIGSWTDQETLMLLEALEIYGDNWAEVSEFVGTKSKAQCISHFIGLSIEDRFFEDMEVPRSFTTVNTEDANLDSQEEPAVKGIDLEANLPLGLDKPEAIMESGYQEGLQSEAEIYVAFEGASNPVMSLVAFLAATVGPRVAAVAAHTALSSLSEHYQATRKDIYSQHRTFQLHKRDSSSTTLQGPISASNVPCGCVCLAQPINATRQGTTSVSYNFLERPQCELSTILFFTQISGYRLDHRKAAVQHCRPGANGREQSMLVDSSCPIDLAEGANEAEKKNTEEFAEGYQCPLSKDSYRKVTSDALATAAMKTKLLADQEEREVQRLAAIIVDNQLKKLSTKLKQLGDIDAVLEKEREQMERNRQRFQAERARFLSNRLSSSGAVPQMPVVGAGGPIMRPAGVIASSPAMPSGAVVPPGGLMPSGPIMPPGGLMPSGAILPSHMLRPTLFTMGPGGMAMPASSPMVRPPS
ncbi:hypothetical protein GOP47_0029394 [Adiantum capillus-veneris]|nr:hypothetical protein GOP47_0029394 [Adiantum capillus-veneris]